MVINLRHPAGGETSGTMIRALGMGACVVLSNRGAFAEMPDEIAVKLDWNDDFDVSLANVLHDLATSPDTRRRIGEAARAYIGAANHIDLSTAGYLRAIEDARTAAPRNWGTVAQFELPPLRSHAGLADAARAEGIAPPLWFALGMLPLGSPGAVLQLAGANMQDSDCALLLGHTLQDGTRPERRSADLALMRLDGSEGDALSLLRALNRTLRFGGVAVISAEARKGTAQSPLMTRAAGSTLLLAAGFTVQESRAGWPSLDSGANKPDAKPSEIVDERVWRAIKVSEFMASAGTAFPKTARRELA